MNGTQPRNPAGTPTGGQFATQQRGESSVELSAADNRLPGEIAGVVCPDCGGNGQWSHGGGENYMTGSCSSCYGTGAKDGRCPRCGGVWGDDPTCEMCTTEDGEPRSPKFPGPAEATPLNVEEIKKLSELRSEFEAAGGRGVELADQIDRLAARERPGDGERLAAAESRRAEQESWERSDTDGFVSQWANGMMGRVHDLQAQIDDQGGTWQFPALADNDGNLIPAKLVPTRYGMAWGLLSDPDDPHSDFSGWVSTSKASTAAKRRATMAARGYREVTVRVPAKATTYSPPGARGLSGAMSVSVVAHRLDGGFSKDAEIVGDWDTD